MKYFIYCRKSSEEEERQALSIESQLQELRDYARKNNLTVVDIFTESKSARKPNNRPVFQEMLNLIEAGQAEGILSWAPDRISRNAPEGALIVDLLDRAVIKDLKFPSFYFESGPQGVFNLSLAFNFGKLYVDNLSQNVKRGIREKIRRGEFPGPAPIGFVNNFKKKDIEADPESFDLVRALFEQYAAGELRFHEIRAKLFDHGVRTRSGGAISLNTIRRMLANPFYTGVFKLKGELHKGSHPKMINQDVFDKVQKRLVDEARKVDWTLEKKNSKGFLFEDLGKCGNCGYTIVQDYHCKKSGLEFRYYKCTRKSKACTCQEPAISEKALAPQIESLVADIAIDDYWYQWCLNEIRSWHHEEQDDIDSQINSLEEELDVCRSKLDRLLDIHVNGDINASEYRIKKNKIVCDSNEIESKILEIQEKGSDWLELLEQSLKTCNQAHHSVNKKDFIHMGKILKKVGSNPILKQREYSVSLSRPFCFFSESVFGLRNCTSPQMTTLKKIKESQRGSEAQFSETGEAGLRKLKEPTLISAQTGYQPRQAKSAEAASVGMCELREKWRRERDSNSRTRVKPSQFLSRKSLSATQPSLHCLFNCISPTLLHTREFLLRN